MDFQPYRLKEKCSEKLQIAGTKHQNGSISGLSGVVFPTAFTESPS